jgi:hypothetical protein
MERASVATDGDSRTAMDGPDLKQSCPLEWVPQALTELLLFNITCSPAIHTGSLIFTWFSLYTQENSTGVKGGILYY